MHCVPPTVDGRGQHLPEPLPTSMNTAFSRGVCPQRLPENLNRYNPTTPPPSLGRCGTPAVPPHPALAPPAPATPPPPSPSPPAPVPLLQTPPPRVCNASPLTWHLLDTCKETMHPTPQREHPPSFHDRSLGICPQHPRGRCFTPAEAHLHATNGWVLLQRCWESPAANAPELFLCQSMVHCLKDLWHECEVWWQDFLGRSPQKSTTIRISWGACETSSGACYGFSSEIAWTSDWNSLNDALKPARAWTLRSHLGRDRTDCSAWDLTNHWCWIFLCTLPSTEMDCPGSDQATWSHLHWITCSSPQSWHIACRIWQRQTEVALSGQQRRLVPTLTTWGLWHVTAALMQDPIVAHTSLCPLLPSVCWKLLNLEAASMQVRLRYRDPRWPDLAFPHKRQKKDALAQNLGTPRKDPWNTSKYREVPNLPVVRRGKMP